MDITSTIELFSSLGLSSAMFVWMFRSYTSGTEKREERYVAKENRYLDLIGSLVPILQSFIEFSKQSIEINKQSLDTNKQTLERTRSIENELEKLMLIVSRKEEK